MTTTISTIVKLLPTKALPPRERLQELAKTSARIFSTTYNPHNARTGNRILRERLRGPTLLDYYFPGRRFGVVDLRRHFPMMSFVDEDERQRLLDVQSKKARGKGAPKKKKVGNDKKKKAKIVRGGGGGEGYVRAKL
ncbi:mitochondrial ribosomal subunit S27-domain-containing protein [Tuber borchii]|uniref:Small ribosomal subunit protein mS33 n=1 Tax=Tuber borchii TaxID=42251 RepID=A0A2T6ZR30_TUBBO|nr:mitochondrial ribosomal subunit S27-domain-containing protein [Tuber borchii]